VFASSAKENSPLLKLSTASFTVPFALFATFTPAASRVL
jgi:hypothetical protein